MITIATITDIKEKESKLHKPYTQIEFTIKVYENISGEPPAQWRVDELLKALNEEPDTPIGDNLLGKKLVLGLENEVYKNHTYTRVTSTLPVDTLDLPEEPNAN